MITAERLREILFYDRGSGLWMWLVCLSNRAPVGRLAGRKGGDGYWAISIDGRRYPSARLAFLYMTGKFPENKVDHIDTNPDNGRWDNLREATNSQNGANRRANRNNTSGFKGVTWAKREKKWMAQIAPNRKHVCLGYFDDPIEAHSAYRAAASKYFGSFANAG